MSSIGGPGGIGGAKGPEGPQGPQGPEGVAGPGEVDEAGGADQATGVTGEAGVDRAARAGQAGDVEALSAEVAAGRLTAREAIDRLVEAAAGPELDATERAELRELMTDLVANDPYLGGLANRV